MGDAGGQLAERGQLLRLDQTVLRPVQIGERPFCGEPGLAGFLLADPQLFGAGVDLGLQGIVRFLHLSGHLVEPIGQGLDLVAGMDLDRLAAFARAQPLGARFADRGSAPPCAGRAQVPATAASSRPSTSSAAVRHSEA